MGRAFGRARKKRCVYDSPSTSTTTTAAPAMYAKEDLNASNPTAEEHVVPMTRLRDSRDVLEVSGVGLPRIGDRAVGFPKKDELEGVSFNRLLEGVDAISGPLTHGIYACEIYPW